jgi:hypothetical protein
MFAILRRAVFVASEAYTHSIPERECVVKGKNWGKMG